MNEKKVRERNMDVLKTAISSIGTGNSEIFSNLYTEDWVLELPYSEPPKVLRGVNEILAYLKPQMGKLEFTLTLTEIFECLDPNLLIAEYVSEGRSTITNKPYQNTYIGLWRFREGKICGVKEYLNPLIATEANTPSGI
ncbi:MAG: nuclear transport factor 2 family protein [Acidimicrobiales bacterium]|nr:nuclear transport factor 2 family protein [Acidimicrobiales bacterium]